MKNLTRIPGLILCILALSCSKKQDSADGWKFANITDSYDIGKEDEKYNDKPVYYIKSNESVDSGFGAAVKSMVPAELKEKRIRLSAFIKTEDVERSAGMWMRVDGVLGNDIHTTLSFDNMMNRPISGTTDWKKYEIVLDVPNESKYIFYGVLISGNGKAWFTEPEFETVGNDIASTNQLSENSMKPGGYNSGMPPKLNNIPIGIEVRHNPQTVSAEFNGKDSMYYWHYITTVKPVNEDLEITEFGSYLWSVDHWKFETETGKPFDKNDFAEWYNCSNGKMMKGQEYTDKNNWNYARDLNKGWVLWYFIGKNSKGDLFKGTAIIDYLPELKK